MMIQCFGTHIPGLFLCKGGIMNTLLLILFMVSLLLSSMLYAYGATRNNTDVTRAVLHLQKAVKRLQEQQSPTQAQQVVVNTNLEVDYQRLANALVDSLETVTLRSQSTSFPSQIIDAPTVTQTVKYGAKLKRDITKSRLTIEQYAASIGVSKSTIEKRLKK